MSSISPDSDLSFPASSPPIQGSSFNGTSLSVNGNVSLQAQDSLAASDVQITPLNPDPNYPLLKPGKIDILTYSLILSEALKNQKQATKESNQQDALQNKDLYASLILRAIDYIQLQARYQEIANAHITIYNRQKQQIQTQNQAISQFNSQVNAFNQQIATMNDHIDRYNKGLENDATYNQAVSQFNAYVNNVINPSVFNYNVSATFYLTQAVQNNVEINTINVERTNLGLPPIPLQSTFVPLVQATLPAPSAPANKPVNSISTQGTLSPLANIIPPTDPPKAEEVIAQYYTPLFMEAVANYLMTVNFLNLYKQQIDYANFILKTQLNPLIPDSIFKAQPTTSSAGVAQGSVIGDATETALLDQMFNRALFEQFLTTTFFPELSVNRNQLFERLGSLGVQLLSQIGLAAGLPAAALIEEQLGLAGGSDTAVKIALSISLMRELTTSISGSQKEIEAYIKTQLGVNLSDSLSSQLASLFKLALLKTVLLQVAINLGLPGLTGQTLANALSLSSTQRQLTNALSQQGYDAQAERIAEQAIQSNRGTFQSAEEVNQSFLAAGLNREEAARATEVAKDVTQSQISSQTLLQQATQSQSIAEEILIAYLEQVLKERGYNEVAIRQATENRGELLQRLLQAGVSRKDAQEIAFALQGNTSSLFSLNLIAALSPEALATELRSTLLQQLIPEIGVKKATKLADQLNAEFLDLNNPRSLLSQLKDALVVLRQKDDRAIDQTLAENFRQDMEPTYDLFNLSLRLLDPGLSLVLCAKNGLMYNMAEPSDFKRDIDIHI